MNEDLVFDIVVWSLLFLIILSVFLSLFQWILASTKSSIPYKMGFPWLKKTVVLPKNISFQRLGNLHVITKGSLFESLFLMSPPPMDLKTLECTDSFYGINGNISLKKLVYVNSLPLGRIEVHEDSLILSFLLHWHQLLFVMSFSIIGVFFVWGMVLDEGIIIGVLLGVFLGLAWFFGFLIKYLMEKRVLDELAKEIVSLISEE